MPVEIAHFARLRDAWEQSSPARAKWPQQVAGMQAMQSKIGAAGHWSYGPSTLMSVLKISRREVANCRVVRWLFDPLARHGIGAAMIGAFGEAIGRDLSDPERARAEVEVSRPLSRADIVITGASRSWTVVIEAKVGAGEGPEQGYRLEQDWLNGDESTPTTYLVFLTTDVGRLPYTARDRERWAAMQWNWFAEAASRLTAAIPAAPDERAIEARHALQDWVATAQRSLR